MKVPATKLFEVVRQVVRDELRKSLPEMIQKHLSEAYVKKLVSEASGRSSPIGMMHDPSQDDETIPTPKKAQHTGIYDRTAPPMKSNEVVSKLLNRNNPMSFIYENVKPIDDAEEESPGIPLEAISPEFETMNRLMEGMESTAAQKAPMPESYELKMKELERKRAALEVKV